ncbi:uracil-xanthine permease family protein [Sanguibacteroides justesenii]|uniref:Xanthine permease n=1 Tax=Sanguibacteroides justesenii TaxID=1547597 RepID=A0A0C3RFW7_9PORP|nr:purine/pyrimidine permease [Sanguibacteroides justesenii]KIO45736.1 xanthine permease [Sanguibacteroides justesenii]
MKYALNDKPSLLPLLMYGLQWFVVSIPSIVILGVIVSQIHYSDAIAQTLYMQKIFGIMGIALIIQVLWGHRLPLIIGPASVLLIGVLASASASVSAVYTAILIGGIFLSLLAYSGLLSKLQFIFTPRIITVILILIAITLSPVILKLLFGEAEHTLFHLSFAILLTLAMIIGNQVFRGIWKSTVVLWALLIGSLLYYGVQGFPKSSFPSSAFSKAGLSFFNFPLEFDAGVILSFIFCFIALIVNELGSIQAVGKLIGANKMEKRTTQGVGVVGITNILSGLVGIVGPIDYSMSPGIISATGCASRYTLIPAGIGLVISAFFPELIIVMGHIPHVVMGAVLLYLMAAQLSAGLQMTVHETAVKNFNNGIVIGFPLMVALLLSFAPDSALNSIPPLIRPIIGNGFVMGVISVLILEHLIFRKEK